MYSVMNAMRIEGRSVEEIARAVSAKRNQIRLASYADNPEGLKALKARNLEEYGHEEGPQADDLYEKYGSWERVLEKSFSVNSGMDACLGLYDDYYELYVMTGQIPGEGGGEGYALSVDGGAASGERYAEGDGVSVTAYPPAKGKTFDRWIWNPDTELTFLDGTSAASETIRFLMPGAPLTLTAAYRDADSVSGGGGGGCYVATAVYGSYDCPEVWTLRRFRDKVLAPTWYGRLFIRLYYAVSPAAVKLFGDCDWFQSFFRERLDSMVSGLQADGFASTPYQDIPW